MLEELVSYYFVTESKIPRRDYDGYKYRLSGRGKKIADRVRKEFKEKYKSIQSLVTTCNKLCNLEATPLSYATKTHYILNESGHEKMTIDDIRERRIELH